MNRHSIIDFLGFIIAKVTGAFFCCVPLRPALWIGRRIGDTAYAANSKRRSIAYANLKSAFPEKSGCELKKINRSHFQNLAMSVVELFKVPVMGRRYLDRHTEVRDQENVKQALKKGRGLIILAGHFGNWEVASLAISSQGYRMSVFAREQKYKRLDRLLNNYRKMAGCRVIAKGFSAREIIKTLKNNGIVAMLGDQNAGPGGVFVKFFGRLASTAPGAVSFAAKTGAEIVPVFMRRAGLDKHEVIFGGPLPLTRSGDKDADVRENLKNISLIFESHIRKFPGQWLWSHKRWKATPERTVLVLGDGKTGHLNQAMAVAEMIERAQCSRLRAPQVIEDGPTVKINAVEIKFKNRFTRILLDLASLFAGRHCQGCLGCLRFCLTKETFEKIKGYSDIVVSCGASTVAAGIFLKHENNARDITIMKPGLGRSNKFDLIILPRHDAPRKVKRNILITEAAPNRVNFKPALQSSCNAGLGLFSQSSCNAGLGLLIGGDAKNFKLTKESVKKVVDGILKIAEEMDRDIFITTSRRTSPEIDSFLKSGLKNHARCKLLVIANEDNIEGAVSKILSMSEVVVVSPESVSMISEAVSSGRHTVIFKSENLATKYEEVIENLESQGYIKTTEPNRVYDVVKDILKEKPAIKKLDDSEKIIKRLQGIV